MSRFSKNNEQVAKRRDIKKMYSATSKDKVKKKKNVRVELILCTGVTRIKPS